MQSSCNRGIKYGMKRLINVKEVVNCEMMVGVQGKVQRRAPCATRRIVIESPIERIEFLAMASIGMCIKVFFPTTVSQKLPQRND